MAIKVPVFVSVPSVLNSAQQEVYDFVSQALSDEHLQARTLGRSDFPQSDPATEVYYLARACYGGVVLGFRQMRCESVTVRPGTPLQQSFASVDQATSWNQIEAGILIAMRRPLLIFAEKTVSGGVFDQGAVAAYLQRFDPDAISDHDREGIRERVRQWSATVRVSFRS